MSDQNAGNRGNRNGRFKPNRRGPGGGGEPRRDRREYRPMAEPPKVTMPQSDCPLCGKPIGEGSSALTERQTKLPAHFDCVLAAIAAQERLEGQERIVYLGSGGFAVIEGDQRSPSRFTIKRKIQYEDKEARPSWRADQDRSIIR